MKSFFKVLGYAALGLLAFGIYLVLPENWRNGIGMAFVVMYGYYMVTVAIRHALEEAQFKELRQLFVESAQNRQSLEQIERQVAYLTRIISQIDKR